MAKSTPRVKSVAAADTHIGKREHNEDAVLVRRELGLFILADGAGGGNAGNIASSLASSTIAHHFERHELGRGMGPFDRLGLPWAARRLSSAVHAANAEIYALATSGDRYRGMGATVVVAYADVEQAVIHIAHVGDCRAYRVRGGELDQLTLDHSLINDVLELAPDLDDAHAAKLPSRVVTRALGMEERVRVSLVSHAIRPGDRFLLCSDGLSDQLDDGLFAEVLRQPRSPDDTVHALMVEANAPDAPDNVAALVVDFERADSAPDWARPILRGRRARGREEEEPELILGEELESVPPHRRSGAPRRISSLPGVGRPKSMPGSRSSLPASRESDRPSLELVADAPGLLWGLDASSPPEPPPPAKPSDPESWTSPAASPMADPADVRPAVDEPAVIIDPELYREAGMQPILPEWRVEPALADDALAAAVEEVAEEVADVELADPELTVDGDFVAGSAHATADLSSIAIQGYEGPAEIAFAAPGFGGAGFGEDGDDGVEFAADSAEIRLDSEEVDLGEPLDIADSATMEVDPDELEPLDGEPTGLLLVEPDLVPSISEHDLSSPDPLDGEDTNVPLVSEATTVAEPARLDDSLDEPLADDGLVGHSAAPEAVPAGPLLDEPAVDEEAFLAAVEAEESIDEVAATIPGARSPGSLESRLAGVLDELTPDDAPEAPDTALRATLPEDESASEDLADDELAGEPTAVKELRPPPVRVRRPLLKKQYKTVPPKERDSEARSQIAPPVVENASPPGGRLAGLRGLREAARRKAPAEEVEVASERRASSSSARAGLSGGTARPERASPKVVRTVAVRGVGSRGPSEPREDRAPTSREPTLREPVQDGRVEREPTQDEPVQEPVLSEPTPPTSGQPQKGPDELTGPLALLEQQSMGPDAFVPRPRSVPPAEPPGEPSAPEPEPRDDEAEEEAFAIATATSGERPQLVSVDDDEGQAISTATSGERPQLIPLDDDGDELELPTLDDGPVEAPSSMELIPLEPYPDEYPDDDDVSVDDFDLLDDAEPPPEPFVPPTYSRDPAEEARQKKRREDDSLAFALDPPVASEPAPRVMGRFRSPSIGRASRPEVVVNRPRRSSSPPAPDTVREGSEPGERQSYRPPRPGSLKKPEDDDT